MATPSSPPSRRILPELETFLQNISKDAPAGPSLRYDPIYDEVRLSRQEDDPRLSMGIWKTELKRADWNKIEDLCVDALVTKTKDLQITAWLTEAWTSLDGIEGYIRGIQLLSALSNTFWTVIHPQPPDDGDMEKRSMIFEWMDSALSSRLLLIPLTQSKLDQTSFGLGYYKSAQHGDAAQRRVDQTRNQSGRNDPSKVIGTIDEFQRSLEKTPDEYLSTQQLQVGKAIESTQVFKNTLATLPGEGAPPFSQILGTLKEMERILKTTLQNRAPAPSETPTLEPTPEIEDTLTADVPALETPTPETIESPPEEGPPTPAVTSPEPEPVVEPSAPEEPPKAESLSEETPTQLVPVEEIRIEETPQEEPPQENQPQASHTGVDLKNRDDAYRQLEFIATFLEQNDPHSLAPQLIRQLIRWEHKNVMDIFAEVAKTPEEYAVLMKILGSHPSEV